MPERVPAIEELPIEPADDSRSESETVVALFRTLIFVVIVLAPRFNRDIYTHFPTIRYAVLAAGIYTLLMSLALRYGIRFRYQRALVLVVDMLLVTLFIFASGSALMLAQSGLFPLYYLLVLVAALWFRVSGALLTAAFGSFVYVLGLIVVEMNWRQHDIGNALVDLLSVNIPLMFLVALLSGYMSEAWEEERRRWLRAQMVLEEFRRQIILARHLQEILLPNQMPEVEGLDIGVAHRPAKVVGGDYYDVLQLQDDMVGVCIADISGKQIMGQMYLPLLKYSLRAATLLFESPGRTLGNLNRMLFPDLHPDRFISMAYSVLDPNRRELTLANAGHLPVLAYRRLTGQVSLLYQEGIVLGVEPNLRYPERQEELQPGDCLVFVTDGVTEALGAEGRPFGLEGVRALVQGAAGQSAQELADAILQAVNQYEAEEKTDDATVLVIRPLPADEAKGEASPPAPSASA